MHRGDHDHDHGGFGHHHAHDNHHAHDHHHDAGPGRHSHAAPGHNGSRHATQWQTPHRPPDAADEPPPRQKDLDLVEASFVEGFGRASDPTSFLRLAGIAFVGDDAEGRRLHLLRVEVEDLTDVGSVAPLLGGAAVRYDPLPARFASRRRQLAFAYHDGQAVVRLDFKAARALADLSEAAHFDLRDS